jgi:hypothetical protein
MKVVLPINGGYGSLSLFGCQVTVTLSSRHILFSLPSPRQAVAGIWGSYDSQCPEQNMAP